MPAKFPRGTLFLGKLRTVLQGPEEDCMEHTDGGTDGTHVVALPKAVHF